MDMDAKQESSNGRPPTGGKNGPKQKMGTRSAIPLAMDKSGNKSNVQSLRSDSNYGSFGQTCGESSSSLSFSGLSSDNGEELDTGSYTSSCMSYDSRRQKRDKVKECLRKLKHLLPSNTENKKKSSTVFALKQALKKIKQLEGARTTGTEFQLTIEEINDVIKTKQGASATNNYLLAVHKGAVIQCSGELEQLLGYPKGYLSGHALQPLIHHRDQQTVSFCIQGLKSSSDEEAVDAGCPSGLAEGPREVYFRLRHFRSLHHGFSVKSTQYLTVHANIVVGSKSVKDETAETKKKTLNYYILSCAQVAPAYKVPMECPDMAIFSTRHSTYCLYTYMHPSTIQYLGYLPQDIENASIFDLYHPNDMADLYNMYEAVIKAGTCATCSKPYRLRAKNDDFITVETTWSCFIDPWTRKLEFLVGQHKVLRGPQHLDIFSSQSSTSHPAPSETDYYRKKIKDLFAIAGKSIHAAQKMIDNFQGPILEQQPDDAKILDSNSRLEDEDNSVEATKVSASYNQVSYSQVIRNFLMSCPQTVFDSEIPTISIISKKLQGTSVKGGHYDENTRVPVANLSTVKPPSFCSSTKALLSEPEPMSPNPAKEMDPMDDTVPPGGEVYKPTKLTKTALRRHTKTQELAFLHQMASAEAKELMRMPEPCEKITNSKKRPLDADNCGNRMAKRLCEEEQGSTWDYQPIMEDSELAFAASQYGNQRGMTGDIRHLSCSQCMIGVSQHPSPEVKVSRSVSSFSPGEQTDATFSGSPESLVGGMSSLPLEDTEGLSEPDISVSSSHFSLPSMTTKRMEEEDGCMSKPLYWPGRIMTVPSWLMIPNWNESSIGGFTVPAQDMKTVLLKDGQWLDCCTQSDYVIKQLNNAVGDCKAAMNDSEEFFLFEPYQLPMLKDIELSTTSCSSYGSKGKGHVGKLKKRSRSKNDLKTSKAKKELIQKVEGKEEEGMCAGQPMESAGMGKSDSGDLSGEKCDSGIGTGQSIYESSPGGKGAKYEKVCQSDGKPMKGGSPNTESKSDSDSNLSNNDHDSTVSGNDRDSNSGNDQDSNTSSNERDLNDPDRSSSPSNSKGEGDSDISSGITPSDQRSNGEVNSSLKESDGVSSKESGSTHSSSDCKPSARTNSDDDAFMSFFSRLFVPIVDRKRPLPHYSSAKLNTKVNPWLEDVGLNKKLEMEYTMESKQLGDVLDENDRLSSKIEQSEMVRLQLDEFLEDVMKVGQADLHEDTGHQDKSYSEILDFISPSRVISKETYWTDMTKAMEIEGDLLTQEDQTVDIMMSNEVKVSDHDMDGSKSSSSQNQIELPHSEKLRRMESPHEKQSVCSKSTRDSGIACSITSSSKDSGQDKESMCSYKRSDEESSDTGRGKDSLQNSSKGSDGDGDANINCT